MTTFCVLLFSHLLWASLMTGSDNQNTELKTEFPLGGRGRGDGGDLVTGLKGCCPSPIYYEN
jgi:hypothetical protein